jgi:hypothetical protein
MLAVALATIVSSVSAEQESCDQCKYFRCLKSTVEYKQSVVHLYEALRDSWKTRNVDAQGTPLSTRDLSKLTEPERSKVYRMMSAQLAEYEAMKIRRLAALTVTGCGAAVAEQSVVTDSFEFCWTQGLFEAKRRQPCRELADSIETREASLAKACFNRQEPRRAYWPYGTSAEKKGESKKLLPPKMLTPYGVARGEIDAHRAEIATLSALIRKLEKGCGKSDAVANGLSDRAP